MSDKIDKPSEQTQAEPVKGAEPPKTPEQPVAEVKPVAPSQNTAPQSAEAQPKKIEPEVSLDKTIPHMAPVVEERPKPADPTPTPQPSTQVAQQPKSADSAPVAQQAPQPTTVMASTPAVQSLPDIENPYMLSGEIDRARLVAQSRLFRGYIEKNAKNFVGENIKRILDIGCGEGQLTQVFAKLYPSAQVVGIDRDEKALIVARLAAKGTCLLVLSIWSMNR